MTDDEEEHTNVYEFRAKFKNRNSKNNVSGEIGMKYVVTIERQKKIVIFDCDKARKRDARLRVRK